tara:strand:- start:1139 stop:1309 length:171 start_codon:yes stop_codon:yes gene_type:complete
LFPDKVTIIAERKLNTSQTFKIAYLSLVIALICGCKIIAKILSRAYGPKEQKKRQK